jgi:AcrR family transcriptional regulator
MYNTAMIAPMLTAISEQFRNQTSRTPQDLRVLGWVFRAALTGYGTLANLGLQNTESFPSAKTFLTASSKFVIEALAASDAPLSKTTKTKNAPAKTAPEDVIEELNRFLSAGATMSFSKKQVSILAAAAAVFSSRGFTEASVDMIADLARASKQTVYSNYKNKTQLYKATCEAVLTRAREESQAALSKINWQADRAGLSKICLILLAQTDKSWLSDFLRVIVGESQSFPGQSGAALSYIYRFATNFLDDFATKHVADAGDRAVMIIWVQGLLGTYVLLNKIYSIEDDQTVNERALLDLVEDIQRRSTRSY